MSRRTVRLALLSAIAAAGCTAADVEPDCWCAGSVPDGELDTACGTRQCLGGVPYTCTGPNTAVRASGTCGTPTRNLRPAGSPDVAVIAVSGHCFFADCPADYNPEYLVRQGSARAVASALTSQGYTAEVFGYGDSFYSWEDTATGEPLVHGFLDLMTTLEFIRDTWIADYEDPTRVIVLGHSHGVVWAHLALFTLEAGGAPLPVDILVDLDGISIGWETDVATGFVGDYWSDVILAYAESTGTTWPLAIWDPADSVAVPGLSDWQDMEDVVPDSVIANIEVWSASVFVTDPDLNHRVDGTRRDLFFLQSAEEHEEVDRVGSDAMTAVVEAIATAYMR